VRELVLGHQLGGVVEAVIGGDLQNFGDRGLTSRPLGARRGSRNHVAR
jgi:hypothetical protein